jgi:DNA-binding PucR family transcriptional regulator
MLSASAPARRILEAVLGPLLAYDEARQAALVPTLRAYLAARFNLTKAAETLYVNPNTVVYRLGRIKALTGRDTHDLDDLVVLYLALKVDDSG